MKSLLQYARNHRFFLCKLGALSTVIMLPLWVMLALKWPRAHDFIYYAGILHDFSSQFWQGQWYPRWLMGIYDGFGSPIMVYHHPLVYFLMTAFEWVAPWDAYGLGRVVLGMQLALVTSGITSFYWLRRHFEVPQAQMGALLYAGFPYLPIVIYYNYGISSLWAIAFFPLVLAAIDRMRDEGWRAVPQLALAFALVCLSHTLTLVTFMLVPVSYALFMVAPAKRLRQCVLLGICGMLAIFLCAIYLLPMQLNQPFIRPEQFITGKYDYAGNFWMIHSLFGFLCFIPPLAGLYFEQPKTAGKRPITPVMLYWLLLLLLLQFMVLPLSKWLWDAVTPLHYLQFPMRFYTGMWPAAVFLAVMWLPKAKTRGIYPFLLIAMLANVTMSSWETWFNDNASQASAKTMVGLENNPQLLPRWLDEKIQVGLFQAPDERQAVIVEGEGEASVLRWSAGNISIRANIKSDTARLLVHQFYFPSWQSVAHHVEPYHGFVSVILSKGAHDVTLSGGDIAGERIGTIITIATGLLLLAWHIQARRKKIAA